MDADKIIKKNIEDWFYHLRAEGIPPNEAAARAIQVRITWMILVGGNSN